MNECVLHGECILHRVKEIPTGAKKKATPKTAYVIAPSETTGNDHVIDCNDGVEFYEKDGVLYMKNTQATQVRCVMQDRHDSITLDPGIWEIDKQREYDYFSQAHRAVAD